MTKSRLTFFILSLLMYCTASDAIDSLDFSVAEIKAEGWALKDAKLTIERLEQHSPSFLLHTAKLLLPAPLDKLSLLKISCNQFVWQKNIIGCAQARARFRLKKLQAVAFDLAFWLKDDDHKINIKRWSLFSGLVFLAIHQQGEQWTLNIKAEEIDLLAVKTLFAIDDLPITQAVLSIDLQLTGKNESIQQLDLKAFIKNIALQSADETLATEDLSLKTSLTARQKKGLWQWQNKTELLTGGVYKEPVFLELDKKNPLVFVAEGRWSPELKKIQLAKLAINHADLLQLQGKAQLNYREELSIEFASLAIHIPELNTVTPLYLLPFLESSQFEELQIAGNLNALFNIQQDQLQTANITLKDLSLVASEQHIVINQAQADINWAEDQQTAVASFINWQELSIQAVSFQAGQLDFKLFKQQLALIKPAKLGLLGGVFSVNAFDFSMATADLEPQVHFNATVTQLSLTQLSKALDWPELSGSISGNIPSVRYQNKKLSLEGELKMQLLGGEVTIKDLASSGILTDFAQFYIDIEFDHLDLAAITKKFDTGHIEGRLSGSIQDLYMENWQPVSFYAWIGTPDDDNSTHKISQKAVENIASIGGGGISDALSRGFMGLFSTFRYDKLGFGCYLHKGVCQLMGVEATENGFYLIKGGGLPRIDVIGYNPRLDWDILLNRLNRIETSDELVVE